MGLCCAAHASGAAGETYWHGSHSVPIGQQRFVALNMQWQEKPLSHHASPHWIGPTQAGGGLVMLMYWHLPAALH